MSPSEAVFAPRIHSEGGDVQAESRIEGAVIEDLRAKGHNMLRSPHAMEPSFSRAQVVEIGPNRWRGGSDPRTGGGFVGFA